MDCVIITAFSVVNEVISWEWESYDSSLQLVLMECQIH